MSDFLADLAAIEAASAVDMTTAPPAVPVHMPEGVPGSEINVTVGLDGAPITTGEGNTVERPMQPYQDYVPPVQQPQPAPAPVIPGPAEPAPAALETAPAIVVPENPADLRRIYAHVGHADLDNKKLLMSLIDANPGISTAAILAAANAQFGIAAPAPVSPTPTAPTQEPRTENRELPTFDTVNSRLDEIDAELENLDNVVDANKWQKLTLEHNRLSRQLPALQFQQAQQQQTADQQIDALITETRNSVTAAYPQISPAVFEIIEDPSKPLTLIADPFALAFAVRFRQDQAAQSPLLEAADYESLVAASIAQQYGVLPSNRQQAPVAPAPGVQQAPAPAAAPVQRPAPQAPQQPGLAPVAAMPAISGALHTNADRVTTQPVNPLANVQADYQEALATGNYEAIERLSAVMATGGQPPQQAFAGLNISYSNVG